MSKVVIALSGGVDSAMAAWILKSQGHEVIGGVYMQNWDVELNEGISIGSRCSSAEDMKSAEQVCRILNIPFYSYNFTLEYWEDVFETYLDYLKKNLNANPDILCNFFIKFGVLLKHVSKDFGADVKLATGHWARIIFHENRYYLASCNNLSKDQTYFLSSLREEQLSKIIFPLCDISSKSELREMARKIGFESWNRKDSMGICFIGKRKYREFIGNYLTAKEGDFIDVETGQVLGKHRGIYLYVLHQSKGLFLKGFSEKYYVCGKDLKKNIVYLCKKSQISNYLHTNSTICSNLHWINNVLSVGDFVKIRTRHGAKLLLAKIVKIDENECVLEHEKIYITSPGQSIVFYDLDERICFGNGMYLGSYDFNLYKK